ncbi:hypothetical protein D9C73_016877 [Collichthys lucidus]|uniref:Immunoglobulin domain-containing protein n=1 Tax=Collichthys lucidus TaxID=240159 RepID=A0A4U5V5D0_COLLU|nr:hypothetical protein D9C73_016877 [Collichthys lucidus]
MAVWDEGVLWVFVVFTVLLTGAVGQHVKYPPAVCAVKGSSVTLPCTFQPLKSYELDGKEVSTKIVRVRWCQNHLICHGTTPSVYDSDSTNNDPRYKYLGDKTGSCTLQITDVQMEDSTTFRFRMEAEHTTGHFTELSGVKVTVTGCPREHLSTRTPVHANTCPREHLSTRTPVHANTCPREHLSTRTPVHVFPDLK